MKPLEALYLALGKEKEAIRTYKKLAKSFPETRQTFTFLMGEEEKHEKIIKGIIEEFSK